MKRNDRFYLYLVWPKYLAQWYAHEMYRVSMFEQEIEPLFQYDCRVAVEDLEPVITQRGSAERCIIEYYLSKQPEAIPEKAPKDATICIEIPSFLGKPTAYYNYLPNAGKALLLNTARVHFRKNLIKYMNKVWFADKIMRSGYSDTRTRLIEGFMQANGIEYDDVNYESVAKVWSRIEGAYRAVEFRKRKRDKANNNENTRD
jgi:hypothetical protein